MSRSGFPLPEGVVEVTDEYHLELVHFELKNLKPRGTILFSGDQKELGFHFFAGEHRADGMIARCATPNAPHAKQILDHLEKYTRIEALVTLNLLQFKVMFPAEGMSILYQNGQRLIKMQFPGLILKTHRRKFVRIPFNEKFPAELRFQTDHGILVRKLRDLSREGMRLVLEPGDSTFIVPGYRMKQAVLKVLNREMPVGLNVVSVYGSESAGIKIVAVSDTDKDWIKDCIRILMSQILGIKNPSLSDEIGKTDPPKKS